jgi:hypothetical protein
MMSWQQRGDKRYYYRHEWIDGRSVRIYQGTGEVGEQAATTDALRRVDEEIAARQRRQEQERRAAAEAPLAQLCAQTDLLVHAALLAAGYHRHDRGEWRRKREHPATDREE